MLRGPLALVGAGVLALAVAACSSTEAANNSAVTVSGTTLSVWVSEPPGDSGGPVATDVLHAEELAFDQSGARVAGYQLRLRIAHADETSADARQAVSDKKTIAYLGESVPGETGVSLQITNQLGILEVSPSDTAIYLTQPTPAVDGSPRRFYPAHSSFHETFARVVPNTLAEAKVLVAAMGRRSVKSLYVADDGSEYGRSEALEVRADAARAGISVTDGPSGASAVFFGGTPSPAATAAVNGFASAHSEIYLPSGLYDPAWVAGLSGAAQRALTVSAPGFLPAHGDPADTAFVSAFQERYHRAPVPQAVFGYEAMSALVAALRQAGGDADQRGTVVDDYRGLQDRASALGTYSLKGGDTSIAPFVLAGVTGGKLTPRSAG